MKAVGLRCRAIFVLATPMLCKRLPLLRAQFLWFYTKHCMGVLIGFVELGIILKLQNSIRYCIMNSFYILFQVHTPPRVTANGILCQM
jgi:hypothetical protein